MQTRLARYEVVLLGVGHTNAHIVRMWRMSAPPDARLTCLSLHSMATYSGMLPAVLAGQYPPARMLIDLHRLTAACGARLLTDPVVSIDSDTRLIHFEKRPPLRFDVLSIGIGSQPVGLDPHWPDSVVPIKPMQTLLDRLRTACAPLLGRQASDPIHIHVVGGGVGGLEITFCLPHFLRTIGLEDFQLHLVSSESEVAPYLSSGARRRIENHLQHQQVQTDFNTRIVSAEPGHLQTEDGRRLASDLTIWATSAVAPDLLSRLNLPRDERGFLWTDECLHCETDAPIFAVGDSGSIRGRDIPKSGVYAVRQGPVLWENIQSILQHPGNHQRLTEFHPQSSFLKLINTGDGDCIAEYHGLSFKSRWGWLWKDWIDGRFMDKHQNLSPMEMSDSTEKSSTASDADTRMRCLGCGGKTAARILQRVLQRIDPPQTSNGETASIQRDDAAVVEHAEQQLTLSVDFFAAPLDDAYTVGRLAALNALSDLFAMGSAPRFALAIVTIPDGPSDRIEETLEHLLLGGLHEFAQSGTRLVGGHTIEGPRLEIGYSVTGGPPARVGQKLTLGDRLILTKPLGSGVTLAAHMQAAAAHDTFDECLRVMLSSNQVAMRLFEQFEIRAMTDVTGFGLAGHLTEMLEASSMSALIDLDAIPLITGTDSLWEQGIESTMAEANRAVLDQFAPAADTDQHSSRFQALFDPQTCGGLLIAVKPSEVTAVCRFIHESSGIEATVIGEVTTSSESGQLITVRTGCLEPAAADPSNSSSM